MATARPECVPHPFMRAPATDPRIAPAPQRAILDAVWRRYERDPLGAAVREVLGDEFKHEEDVAHPLRADLPLALRAHHGVLVLPKVNAPAQDRVRSLIS